MKLLFHQGPVRGERPFYFIMTRTARETFCEEVKASLETRLQRPRPCRALRARHCLQCDVVGAVDHAQSPYSAGLVSGRNAQSRAALTPAIAAIVRNPVKSPKRLAMNPAIAVLTAVAMAVRVPIA